MIVRQGIRMRKEYKKAIICMALLGLSVCPSYAAEDPNIVVKKLYSDFLDRVPTSAELATGVATLNQDQGQQTRLRQALLTSLASNQNLSQFPHKGPTTAVLSAQGMLSDADQNKSCSELREMYGIPEARTPNYIDDEAMQAPQKIGSIDYGKLSCADFEREFLQKGVLDRSVTLAQQCLFDKASLRITKSNIRLDCKGSLFRGGTPDAPEKAFGIGLIQNDKDSPRDASSMVPITNVAIRNCNFENYKTSGITLENQFNRSNKADQAYYEKLLIPMQNANIFDLPGNATNADILRDKSPKNFYIGNVTVRNTANAGIYVFNSISRVDINNVKLIHTRHGIYQDYGTRDITVRNSCFMNSGVTDPRKARDAKGAFINPISRGEGVAVDSSARNNFVSNLFYKPSAGALYFYKNCWESHNNYKLPEENLRPYSTSRGGQFPRRQPPSFNLVKNNVMVGGVFAVKLAARQWSDMGGNEANCGDRPVATVLEHGEKIGIFRDYASQNAVIKNLFFNPVNAVANQDDYNQIVANVFRGTKGQGPVTDTQYETAVQIGHVLDEKYKPDKKIKGSLVIGNKSYVSGISNLFDLYMFYPSYAAEPQNFLLNTHTPQAPLKYPVNTAVDPWSAPFLYSQGEIGLSILAMNKYKVSFNCKNSSLMSCNGQAACKPGHQIYDSRAICNLKDNSSDLSQLALVPSRTMKVTAVSRDPGPSFCQINERNLSVGQYPISGELPITYGCSSGSGCSVNGELVCQGWK